MKLRIFLSCLFIFTFTLIYGQAEITDSTRIIKLEEVIITTARQPVSLKRNPGAISLVTPEVISGIPKGIGAEEALRLVPGVRIDNQHDAERIHISIRGQGILTERGLRGIGVFIDGIPVNDPSGFAPDLYDVDWNTVQKIEVMRGPAASLYGGAGAAGVINIITAGGGTKPVGGQVAQSIGSNGFFKERVQFDGSHEKSEYRISYSRTDGDGYRDHQAYWSNKLYEKLHADLSDKLSVTQIMAHTDYFQQNPEGLNLGQFDNLLQANPDARPFNEYQKSNRTTIGLNGVYKIDKLQEIETIGYLRSWNYKETSNKAAEYRTIFNPGFSIQYNLYFNAGELRNNISIGSDLKWQNIQMYKLKSASNPDRIESTDETNIETDTLLANQIIYQKSTGIFALYNLEAGNFLLTGSIRYDDIKNQLTNKMFAPDSAKTSKDFSEISGRVGVSYSLAHTLTFFANWGKGFIPPSTEELASNPLGYSGFNTHLISATSSSYELGIRGFFNNRLNYEITGFLMNTNDDFFRFKQSGRGNQEVFYGNAGNSKRYGIEMSGFFRVIEDLSVQFAYTFADFKYTSSKIDPVYTDTAYVLTMPPEPGQWLPNSPRHQLYLEAAYSINKNLKLSVGTEYQSKWAIYTDAKAYNGELDPTIYKNWQNGFNLYNARLLYQWKIGSLNGECSLSVRNITGEKYMAFTEPDPDGNSYQPGPGREFFGRVKVRF